MQVIWCLKFCNMTESGGQYPAPNSGGLAPPPAPPWSTPMLGQDIRSVKVMLRHVVVCSGCPLWDLCSDRQSLLVLPLTVGDEGIILSGRPSVVRPPISTCFAWHNRSLLSGDILRNFSKIFIIWVGIAEKVFKVRGQRSRSWPDQF